MSDILSLPTDHPAQEALERLRRYLRSGLTPDEMAALYPANSWGLGVLHDMETVCRQLLDQTEAARCGCGRSTPPCVKRVTDDSKKGKRMLEMEREDEMVKSALHKMAEKTRELLTGSFATPIVRPSRETLEFWGLSLRKDREKQKEECFTPQHCGKNHKPNVED